MPMNVNYYFSLPQYFPNIKKVRANAWTGRADPVTTFIILVEPFLGIRSRRHARTRAHLSDLIKSALNLSITLIDVFYLYIYMHILYHSSSMGSSGLRWLLGRQQLKRRPSCSWWRWQTNYNHTSRLVHDGGGDDDEDDAHIAYDRWPFCHSVIYDGTVARATASTTAHTWPIRTDYSLIKQNGRVYYIITLI